MQHRAERGTAGHKTLTAAVNKIVILLKTFSLLKHKAFIVQQRRSEWRYSWMKQQYLFLSREKTSELSPQFTEGLGKSCSSYNAERRLSSTYLRMWLPIIISRKLTWRRATAGRYLTRIQLMQIKLTMMLLCRMHSCLLGWRHILE